MRIAIIGTGAMGSVYAALLADAGHDVWAIDAWPEHVAAMRERGLRVEGASGDRTVRLNASERASDVERADLVIIATKADGVADAARSVEPILGSDTVVLTIQNGLGSAERVAEILGTERVMIGVVGGFGASMKGPGHAHHNGMEFVRLGEYEGSVSERLERTAEVWRSGGFKVLTFDDIHKMVWEKLICNVTYSGTCTLTGLTVGQVQASEEAWSVASGCGREAYEVAVASAINLSFDDPVAYVKAFGEKIPNARPSMLLDHLAGRHSEIDVINGAIPPAAQKVGRDAPINRMVSTLIRAKESGFTTGN